MENDPKNISRIVPQIKEFILPSIKEAVDICINSYLDDKYNDTWTFATQLWKNIWNRIYETAIDESTPIHLCGKQNEYKFRIDSVVLHHHRIDSISTLPTAAKAAKTSADAMQLALFDLDSFNPTHLNNNIILAIDANYDNGLKEVFIGELERISLSDKKYKWKTKIPVYKNEMTLDQNVIYEYSEEAESNPIVVLQPNEAEPDSLVSFNANESRIKKGNDK